MKIIKIIVMLLAITLLYSAVDLKTIITTQPHRSSYLIGMSEELDSLQKVQINSIYEDIDNVAKGVQIDSTEIVVSANTITEALSPNNSLNGYGTKLNASGLTFNYLQLDSLKVVTTQADAHYIQFEVRDIDYQGDTLALTPLIELTNSNIITTDTYWGKHKGKLYDKDLQYAVTLSDDDFSSTYFIGWIFFDVDTIPTTSSYLSGTQPNFEGNSYYYLGGWNNYSLDPEMSITHIFMDYTFGDGITALAKVDSSTNFRIDSLGVVVNTIDMDVDLLSIALEDSIADLELRTRYFLDSTITDSNPITYVGMDWNRSWKGVGQQYNLRGLTWNAVGIDSLRIYLQDTLHYNATPYFFQMMVNDGTPTGTTVGKTKLEKLSNYIKKGTAPNDTIFTWSEHRGQLYDSTLTNGVTLTDDSFSNSTYSITCRVYDKDSVNIITPFQAGGQVGTVPGYSYYYSSGTSWNQSSGDSTHFAFLQEYLEIDSITQATKITDLDNMVNEAYVSANLAYSLADSIKNRFIEKTPTSNLNIAIQGTSITWGNGNLMDTTLTVSGYLMNDLLIGRYAYGLHADELDWVGATTNYNNPKIVRGRAIQMDGSSLSGDGYVDFYWYYDELHIGYIAKRTDDYGEITVRADKGIVGIFTNKNTTMGTESESLTWKVDGADTTKSYPLKHPYTYDHNITVDGDTWSAVTITDAGTFGSFTHSLTNKIVNLVRSWDANGNVIHSLVFPNDLTLSSGASIETSYKYGKMICVEKSTVGQFDNDAGTTNNTDSLNECNYGMGGTVYDPINPTDLSSGLEFREIDKESIWSIKFAPQGTSTNTPKRRLIRIRCTGGSSNPYLIINYVSNRKHHLINAGIGGLGVPAISGSQYTNLSWKNIYKEGSPDMIFIQSGGTNETLDSTKARHVKRVVTGLSESEVKGLSLRGNVDSIKYESSTTDYTVRFTSGIIDAVSDNSITSADIVTSCATSWNCNPEVGDYLRIGTYYGDWREFQTRIIKTINTSTGYVTFDKPIRATQFMNVDSLPDLVGAEIQIRKLDTEYDAVKGFVDSLQNADNNTKIFLVESENSDQSTRVMWGYDKVMESIADSLQEVTVVKVGDRFQDYAESSIYGSTTGTARDTVLTSNLTEIYPTYSTTFTEWSNSHWQGFAIYKDGTNVYGKDCYWHMGRRYAVSQSLSGSNLDLDGAYGGTLINPNGRFVWRKNFPQIGDELKIMRAWYIWSGDFTHPNFIGGSWYNDIYNGYIDKFINK